MGEDEGAKVEYRPELGPKQFGEGGLIGTNTLAGKPSEHKQALLELDTELETTMSVFSKFAERLAPICRNVPSDENKPADEPITYSTSLANDIHSRVLKLRKLRRAIQSINKLVDI